jgi:hypothetical protein
MLDYVSLSAEIDWALTGQIVYLPPSLILRNKSVKSCDEHDSGDACKCNTYSY